MSTSPTDRLLSRRTLLTAGGAAGLLAVGALAFPGAAFASGARPQRPSEGPVITDLGPAMVQYSLMSGILLDGVYYVGSRNLEPAGVVGVDLATGKVVRQTTLPTGYAVQALAADSVRGALYIGVLQKTTGDTANGRSTMPESSRRPGNRPRTRTSAVTTPNTTLSGTTMATISSERLSAEMAAGVRIESQNAPRPGWKVRHKMVMIGKARSTAR